MPEYQFAEKNGNIIVADYSRSYTLKSDQVKIELENAFNVFGNTVSVQAVSEDMNEVYQVSIPNGDSSHNVYVCAKGTTPGGRNNLMDEQRIQQKAKYINYVYDKLQNGEKAILLGIYKRDGEAIFCAWRVQRSNAASPDTPISKQIKIQSISKAITEGFVQQDKGHGEYACAFRKEFLYFYLKNSEWLHTGHVSELADHSVPESNSFTEEQAGNLKYLTELVSKFERNRILFGAPGTGKSYTLNQDKDTLLKNGGEYERVTFHPDYSYANFVGTYKPTMLDPVNDLIASEDEKAVLSVLLGDKTAQEKYDLLYDKFKDGDLTRLPLLLGLYNDDKFKTKKKDGSDANGDNSVERNHGRAIRPYVNLISNKKSASEIAYEYVPGPFMRTYVKALKNAQTDNPKPYLLIVEEINRANVAAVFGDVFQLLDRDDDNVSEYAIQTSEDIKKYLAKELGGKPRDYTEIKIPDNMFIWATMNSADQGVFPMDTAFKRRWDFTYLGIDDSEEKIVGKTVELGKGVNKRVVEWNELRKTINDELLSYKVNEDKLLGPYFLSKKIIPENDPIDPTKFIATFKSKVIMYLFDDAAKQKRQSLFDGCNDKTKYSSICKEFEDKGVFIFGKNISDKFAAAPTTNHAEDGAE
ncbi:AAA family ATPase [Oceanobacillus massiliensis]|uniref:AAA family ATPase n=1 Tax=Oceanobacillus massiliensis TaxID=1465765 RepID=UPI0002884463|nr:AAA family ATPase [Oceanobacillus massiliensis]